MTYNQTAQKLLRYFQKLMFKSFSLVYKELILLRMKPKPCTFPRPHPQA